MPEPVWTPVAGKYCKVDVINNVPATPITKTIPGINWSLDPDGKETDTSNFLVGRDRITTLDDMVVTFSLIWNETDQPTDTATSNIRLGSILGMKFYVDKARTRFWTATRDFVVTKLGPKVGGQEDKLMMDVTAGMRGEITYPVATPAP